jgi:curved DNA-binding protein CbpA
VADPRYQKFLGIEPSSDKPTYYELLDVPAAELDEEKLEVAYKTQIRKLQQIRTSKDAGFIEFCKETLREARRVLKDPGRRQTYDATLAEGAEKDFKEFVLPLLALGQLSQVMIDTVLVPKGLGDGLTEDRCRQIISDLAAENGVTIEEGAPDQPDDDDGYDDDSYDDGYDDPAPAQGRRSGGEVVLQAAPGWKDRGFVDDATAAATVEAEAPPQAVEAAPPWILAEQDVDRQPWGRGGSRSWGQARVRQARRRTTDLIDDSWLDEDTKRVLVAALRVFNHGARLAKVGSDVHRNLRMYFPPNNGKTTPTPKISGVTYEKLFETERKTYQDTLKAFRDAANKIGDVESPRADEIRERGAKNMAMVKGILEDMNKLKMTLMGGLSQAEELRAWQAFVGGRRSPRLHRTIDEPKG